MGRVLLGGAKNLPLPSFVSRGVVRVIRSGSSDRRDFPFIWFGLSVWSDLSKKKTFVPPSRRKLFLIVCGLKPNQWPSSPIVSCIRYIPTSAVPFIPIGRRVKTSNFENSDVEQRRHRKETGRGRRPPPPLVPRSPYQRSSSSSAAATASGGRGAAALVFFSFSVACDWDGELG